MTFFLRRQPRHQQYELWKKRVEFTYLKDTEVFYTEDPFADIGDSGPQFERTEAQED